LFAAVSVVVVGGGAMCVAAVAVAEVMCVLQQKGRMVWIWRIERLEDKREPKEEVKKQTQREKCLVKHTKGR
jgi:uncharacterized protein YaiI (UPF0178 family)